MEILIREGGKFPKRLMEIEPKVEKIFFEGEWKEEKFEKCVAIVGSRRMTNYGQRVIEKIVPILVENGVTIVSGFMYGVDQEAQQKCVEMGGVTIGVLGWGLEKSIVAKEEKLREMVLDGGGIIMTEYEGQEGGRKWNFLERNRIVAGLCKSVIVVEGAEKSGTMNTAEWARKMGRQLWAVPGMITSSVSGGTNKLIKEGKAKMLTSIEELIKEDFNYKKKNKVVQEKVGILGLIDPEGNTIDELVKKAGMSVEELSIELMQRQLMGEVREIEGKFFVKE